MDSPWEAYVLGVIAYLAKLLASEWRSRFETSIAKMRVFRCLLFSAGAHARLLGALRFVSGASDARAASISHISWQRLVLVSFMMLYQDRLPALTTSLRSTPSCSLRRRMQATSKMNPILITALIALGSRALPFHGAASMIVDWHPPRNRDGMVGLAPQCLQASVWWRCPWW